MRFGVQRARMVTIGLLSLVLALFAGRIFDRFMPILIVTALLPTAVGLLVRRRSDNRRRLALLVTVVVSVAVVVLSSGGGVSDVAASFTSGFVRMLSTDWPSPDTADLIGTAAFVLSGATAIGVETASRRRYHLIPLIPLCLTSVVIIAVSAPQTVQIGWLAAIAGLTVAFALLRTPDVRTDAAATAPTPISTGPHAFATPPPSAAVGKSAGLAHRLAVLRGERALLPVIVLASLLAVAVSLPLDFARRSDPRRNDPADRTAALFDPIESTLALRAISPPIELHSITNVSPGPVPTRWRTTALDTFNGDRWSPTSTLRPIGRRLGPGDNRSISYEVSFLDTSLPLVPIPGQPITIDGQRAAAVETDDMRTVVRLIERPDSDTVLDVTAALPPSGIDAGVPTLIAARPVDDQVSALAEFAGSIAGDGTLAEQLLRIEETMRSDFVLAADAPGAGQQQALIERFLRETKRGTAEQFATGFVLLARALGVDARVATGFIIGDDDADSTSAVLTSAHAGVWPEVHLASGAWVALDPVPEAESTDIAQPPEEPAVQTPAAAQPPINQPPDVEDATSAEENVPESRSTATSAAITRFIKRYGAVTGIFVLPIIFVMLSILGMKLMRRRRRLRALAAADRVRGAWSVATDHLVDAGLDIDVAATNGEIAVSGSPLAGASRHELWRLATMSSAVTFGDPPGVETMADDAAGYLRALERTMANDRTIKERTQWRLSARSLRRKTRSPVRD